MRAWRVGRPVKASKGNTMRTAADFLTLTAFVFVLSAAAHAQTSSSPPSLAASAVSVTTESAEEQGAPAAATGEQLLAEKEPDQLPLADFTRVKGKHGQATPMFGSPALARLVRMAWARA